MAITSSYLVAVSRLGEMLEAIRAAQAPDRFTLKFLEELGFTSTNDRLLVGLLKSLGFLDANGVPQTRYYEFLDGSESKRVLAEGIREAYEDLFRIRKDAHKYTKEQVKGKLKSLTQGQLSDSVLENMARTFLELVKHADFDSTPPSADAASVSERPHQSEFEQSVPTPLPENAHDRAIRRGSHAIVDALSYRIEIVLPNTRDRAVYDAIFRSLREHLL